MPNIAASVVSPASNFAQRLITEVRRARLVGMVREGLDALSCDTSDQSLRRLAHRVQELAAVSEPRIAETLRNHATSLTQAGILWDSEPTDSSYQEWHAWLRDRADVLQSVRRSMTQALGQR